jgi:hypothetical protein
MNSTPLWLSALADAAQEMPVPEPMSPPEQGCRAFTGPSELWYSLPLLKSV